MTNPFARRARHARLCTALFALAGACLPAPLAAQDASAPSGAVLVTGRDMALVGGATLGAAVLSRLDVRFARAFTDSGFHARHPGFTTAARRASLVTETALMAAGGVVYGVARIRKDAGTADVAFHATESVAATAMLIQVVRGVVGRARPFVIDDSGGVRDATPYDFRPMHGFTSFNYRSFPSMHAMASFAVASALSEEMRLRGTPHREVIAPMLYAGAAMPALARLYLDEHWTSDIAMGVFLGIFAGQKAVGFSHAHADNRVDRAFLGPRASVRIGTDGHTMSVSVSPFEL